MVRLDFFYGIVYNMAMLGANADEHQFLFKRLILWETKSIREYM